MVLAIRMMVSYHRQQQWGSEEVGAVQRVRRKHFLPHFAWPGTFSVLLNTTTSLSHEATLKGEMHLSKLWGRLACGCLAVNSMSRSIAAGSVEMLHTFEQHNTGGRLLVSTTPKSPPC